MDSQNQHIQTPNQKPSVNSNSSESKVIPIALGVVAVTIIAIGSFILGTKQIQPQVQNIVQTTPLLSKDSATEGIPTPIPVGQTANWKTYTNTKYNFTFKYPITWQTEEVNDNSLRIIRMDGTTDKTWDYDAVSWYVNYQDLENAKRFIYDNKLQKWGLLTWKDYYNPTGPGKFTEIDQLFTTEAGHPVYCLSKEGGADQLIVLSSKLFIVIDMGGQRCIRDSTYPSPEDKIYKIIQSFNLISS